MSKILFILCTFPSLLWAAPIDKGVHIDDSTYPSVVKIESVIPGAVYGCSGTLISPTVILTAAHCVHRTPKADDIKVNGPDQKDDKKASSAVAAVFENELARAVVGSALRGDPDATASMGSQSVDLAILVLKKPMDLKEYPKIACKGPADDENTLIVGFGEKNDNSNAPITKNLNPEGFKHFGTNVAHCVKDPNGMESIQQSTTLADQEYAAPGQLSTFSKGDSGGPLLTSDSKTIYGVASQGFDTYLPAKKTYGRQTVHSALFSENGKAFLRAAAKKFPTEFKEIPLCP